MAASHYILHGNTANVQIPLTRFEALKFFRKWSRTAQRHTRKGHRTLFLLDVHKGFTVDRLVIETVHEKVRQHHAKRWTAPEKR
jgi:hypothetical protein